MNMNIMMLPLEREQALHIINAALLAILASLLLSFQQIRHAFHNSREEFATYQRHRVRCHGESAAAVASAKKKGRRDAEKYPGKIHGRGEKNTCDTRFVVGFFHPRCSAGGGGERVLWKLVQALGELREGKTRRRSKMQRAKATGAIDDVDLVLKNLVNLSVVIYTVDEPSESYDRVIMKNIRERFAIALPPSLPVNFVHLHEFKHYIDKPKRLTMIAESWGSMKLAWCALGVVTPHVFIDTTGCAFTFFVAKVLAGCKVVTYVHYPTISTDMLSLVWERRPSYNNHTHIATNPIVTYVKLIYYVIFATGYGLVGSFADLTMVNSTWTKNHIRYLWKLSRKIKIVFPPVDTKSLKELPMENRKKMVISIGQFRPEKDHGLQLISFAKLLDKNNGEMKKAGVKLILIGSCRGEGDQERVDQLQKLARELKIQENVEFALNQPYTVLVDYLREASVGIHTMWNEHFGIGVVEMMAAGLITVAHNSGGPKSDIILRPWNYESILLDEAGGPTGCLAGTADEYAVAMYEILRRGASSEEMMKMRVNGRKTAGRFSDEVFMDSFKEAILLSTVFRDESHPVFRWRK